MKKIYILFWLYLVWWHPDTCAQVNVLGKPGHIMTPSAFWDEGKHLGLSFAHIPAPYAINNFMKTLEHDEDIYSVRVALTDFLEVNLNITRIPALSDKIGVGDRHLDIRIKLLEEKKVWPALALIISPPGSRAPFISHDVLVASKRFDTGNAGNLSLTAGYGLPFYLKNDSDNVSTIWDRYPLTRKSEIGNHYLTGFFGAVLWRPWEFLGFMAEHDSRSVNMGAVVKVKEWLMLQGHSYEGKKVAFSVAVQVPLDFEPKELRGYGK